MTNRDAIVRKLNALKAKFEHAATGEAEALAAMSMYNKLMQQYNLTETDLELKASGVHFANIPHQETKQMPPMARITTAIGMLSNTKALWKPGYTNVVFFGTMADIQYAEFLYRLIKNAYETSWHSYHYSYEYTDLKVNKRVHGKKIRSGFLNGFMMRMTAKIEDLLEDNKQATGNSLVVLKQALIVAALEEAGIETGTRKAPSRYTETDAVMAGGREADKVRLRQEAEDQTPLMIEGK